MTMVFGMSKHVSITAFKARVLEFLDEVEKTGESLIVTDHGRPVAEVRPVASKPEKDPREILRNCVLFYERPFDPVDEED
jgi:prevent-host-death family protein